MAVFNAIAEASRDCRTITIPDVFNGGGDFNLSTGTPTAATLTMSPHNASASDVIVNVLSTGDVSTTDVSVIDGTDIQYQPSSLARIPDGVWTLTFDYTYTPGGGGSITESVCLCVLIGCTMLRNLLCLAKENIGDPECVKCFDECASCEGLDLLPLYEAAKQAAALGLCYQAAEFFTFISQAIDEQSCPEC